MTLKSEIEAERTHRPEVIEGRQLRSDKIIIMRGMILVLGQIFLGASAQEEQLFERLKRDLQQFSKNKILQK